MTATEKTPETGTEMLKLTDILKGVFSLGLRILPMMKHLKAATGLAMDTKLGMGTFIEENAVQYADNTALLFEDQKFTYKEFNEIINKYANYFISQGIQKGDTVVVFIENRPEILFVIVALAKIGGIASLINPNQRGPVLEYSINLIPFKMVVVGEELVEAFEEIRPILHLADDQKVYWVSEVQVSAPENYLDLKEEIASSSTENPPTTAGIQLKDPFAYIFTSGTTGRPKAAIIPHLKYVAVIYGLGRAQMNLTTDDTIYVPLPFSHATGLLVAWAPAVAGGAALAMSRRFSVSGFWPEIKKHQATAFGYIGELCRYLLNQPESPDDKNNTIKKIIGNGLRPDIWMEFKNRFGISKIHEFYAASEGNAVYTNILNLDRTIGFNPGPHALVEYDVEADEPVHDENGRLIRVGKGGTGLLLGEITDTTPFLGYTDEKETNKKILRNVFEDGDAYFNTGDLIRDIGFKHGQFVDRVGDTFRWKGENVSTTQVEEVMNVFEQVNESTVYGVTIEGTEGRAGMASIIPEVAVEEFDLGGLAASLKKGLPSYAVPVFIRFQDAFELTATLKYKKINLKNEGFNPEEVTSHLYVLLPGSNTYEPLTLEIYDGINSGKYRF